VKAVIVSEFGGPEGLIVTEAAIPVIARDQVLIRVEAASVNFADIKARRGVYHLGGKPPFIPGIDAAGTVEAVGENVTHVNIGQRVIAFPSSGSYAEYAVAQGSLVFPLPDEVDFETAAAIPIVSFTAYKLLADIAGIQPKETVLLHAAAGGVGTMAVQLAKLLGAGCVIGTVGSAHKAQAALDAGADCVIDMSRESFVQAANELTGGKGVDIVLDSLGGAVTEQSLACLAKFGRLAAFGDSSGTSGAVPVSALTAGCRSVCGFSLGTMRKERPEQLAHTAERILELLKQERLTPVINRTYTLEEASEAHRWIESRQSIGKTLLKVR